MLLREGLITTLFLSRLAQTALNGTCSAGDSEASIATKSFERRGRGLQNTDQIAWQDLASEYNPLNNYSLNTLPRGMIMMDAIMMMTMITIIVMVDG